MRKIFIAFALALSPLTLAAGCATFEQVQPKTPRQALADADVALVGVADVAGTLYGAGYLSHADVARIAVILRDVSDKLDQAHTLLKAGETLAASKSIADVTAALAAISLELSTRSETPTPKPAPPVADGV